MSDEHLKAFLGSTYGRPEEEYHPDEDLELIASKRYDHLNIITTIGTPEFEANYRMVIGEITDFTERRDLAREIIKKIWDIYEIEFHLPQEPSINEVNDIFKFLEFVEYNYINFVSDVWKFFDVNLRKINIFEYCQLHGDRFIQVIEELVDSHFLPVLLSDFLRTYNKDDMIRMFTRMSEDSKMLIVLNIESEELQNVRS
ncbi:hypothetical protein KAR91_37840 [Candidatus Pacearchaeota archaeon]|nr:hypothetical protein [Candidatus Pacearchaeota archaeon]